MEYRGRHPGSVFLGAGVDTLSGGTREPAGQSLVPITYSGEDGHDTISYVKADRGVSVTPEDGLANDGPLLERENVSADFDTIEGPTSPTCRCSARQPATSMIGHGGNDQISGGGGNDVFVSRSRDGADDYHGGPGGFDAIDYFGAYGEPGDRSKQRLDNRLASQKLTTEVEATDTRGARQLERDAATVRVTQ